MSAIVVAPHSGRNAMRDRDRIAECLASRQAFRNSTGSLRGEPCRYGPTSTGRLPAGLSRRDYEHDVHRSAYVVMSYATPIAWLSGGMWVVPDVAYSHTTSRQQGMILVALAKLDVPVLRPR